MNTFDNIPFCGQHDSGFQIGGVTYQWPRGSHLTWSLGFSRLGALDDLTLKEVYKQAFAEISACCNVTHAYTSNSRSANILVNVQRLDGPSGVLADMQLPVGNVDQSSQLLGRIDDSEVWGVFDNPPPNKIDLYRVVLHELLHAHGLGHKPDSVQGVALIAPMYSRSVRNLQALDIKELQRRYGEPKTQSPTAPTQPPTAGTDKLIVEELRVSIGGKRYRLSGSVGPMQMVAEE